MKLLITREIDGFNVITKIEGAGGLIDPEATRQRAVVELRKTDVHKEIDRLKNQMSVYVRQMIQAGRNAKDALKRKDNQSHRKFSDEYKLREGQTKEIEKELKPLARQYQAELKNQIRANAVYFIPKPGEEVIEDAEAATIKTKMEAAYAADSVLTRDMKQVCDYRGNIYYKKISGKWQGQEISRLGIEPAKGSVLAKNLSEADLTEITEQAEADRIAALKPDARQAEKEAIITGLANMANAMRGRLEIQGDSKALQKAQDWYNAEVAKAEAKYK